MRAPIVTLTALLALSSTPALAEPDVLAVVPLDALGVEPGLLMRLDAAVRERVTASGAKEADPASVSRAAGERPCAGDAACLSALGKRVGAASVVAGSVGVAGDTLNIALKVIDVATGVEKRVEQGQAPLDQAEAAVRALAFKLLDPAGYNASGAISVDVGMPGATVLVDGAPRGTTPLIGPIGGLPPGRRAVEVRAPGVQPWRKFVEAPVDGVARIRLVQEGDLLVERAATAAGKAPTGGKVAVSPLVWAGAGALAAGVASGIGGAVAYGAAVGARDRFVGGERGSDVIQENQTATLAFGVLAPLGLVGVGGGIALVTVGLME
ncbi:MAG: hypothetical protein HYS27_20985 [Deltaproteobacteria bacterium]|nr:hypothetical protein [Deltaproteobacteria bacterium]